MLRLATLLVLALAVGCASSGQGGYTTGSTLGEAEALARIGDVRVYFYQKPGIKPSARTGNTVEQPRKLHVLVNRGHSFYEGKIPDYRMKPEENYLRAADMHELLVYLQKHAGFFERGASVNIKGDDPVARAGRENNTDRMIAVEQIKDGVVNTSYFARRVSEESLDAERARKFNLAQVAVLTAVGSAEPRGYSGTGPGQDIWDQQKKR